jgi:hypothetical protein
MATITRGYNFQDGEQLTPGKMNDLVDLATITDVTLSDFGSALQAFNWGDADPGVSPGGIWYDTGADPGCKFAFVSPSNASISDWLYATPRREAIYWTESSVSLGTPMMLYRRGFEEGGAGFKVYDGALLPTVWEQAGSASASELSPYLVIAMESVGNGSPVKCAWAGLVPAWTHESQVTQTFLAQIDPTDSNRIHTDALYQGELRASLVSYWKMDEASGASRADSHGTFHLNNAGDPVPDVSGLINNAMDGSNVGDRRLAAAVQVTSGASTWEMSAWVNYATINTGSFAACWDDTSGDYRSWHLLVGAGGKTPLFQVSSDGTVGAQGTITATTFGALSTGTWYLVTWGFDGDADEIFVSVNGVEDAASWADGIYFPGLGNTQLTFGARSNGIGHANCDIDECAYWHRRLTADERSTLYNSGAGRTYPLAASVIDNPNIFGLVLRTFDNDPPDAKDFWLWGTGAVNSQI